MRDHPSLSFAVQVNQNKYLAPTDQGMHVVVTVRASRAGAPAACAPPRVAEVLLVDCSSSMDWPPTKIDAARHACRVAIDTLRDGALFGVVEGTGAAKLVYPAGPGLAVADARTRREAKAAVSGMIASGGTAMSTWLDLARELFERSPAPVRHAVLLTDGNNQSEAPGALDDALDRCRDRFACDARGIGADWEPMQLRRIASALGGRADAVVADDLLADDFRQLVEQAMGRTAPEVRLRLRLMPRTGLRFVKQVFPALVDLTGRCRDAGEAIEVPIGDWGQDQREYHLCLDVDTAALTRGRDRLLGVVALVVADEHGTGAERAVVGHLTDDLELSSVLDNNVAQVTDQAELARAVDGGWVAVNRGDLVEAAREWGAAHRLAIALGHTELRDRLEKLIEARPGGQVVIKDEVDPRYRHSAILPPTISSHVNVNPLPRSPLVQEAGAPRTCGGCGRAARPTAKCCGHCGTAFTGDTP
ncbi:vWA domain-containing protein [Actinokineospora pegani]|uniref:vWA domain-containing protein n=1 Tax=Actinokineospora pegani TaxID=2654637 RepID=UPI001F3AB2A5|nr:vWA domain-containing protein [Actinokineospora pegani]